ncbi:MAG: serine/threonine-protein phosphatase [Lachnospiraceae bacterium]|nr:serine/threonine-protein phosphatase [Lachnospiraceae bacterium]
MKFGYVYETGMRKENQDALLYRLCQFSGGELAFLAVCDGMGGMECGMEASAICIREMEAWFDGELIPFLEKQKRGKKELKKGIQSKGFSLYRRINHILFEKMRLEGKKMGSTALLCLVYRERYYLFHIGDGRAYLQRKALLFQGFRKLTKDHGDERGLLKCLGLNREWKPDFYTGRCKAGGMLLCTDGFYRKYDKKLWKNCLAWKKLQSDAVISKRLKEIGNYNIRQKETDNISALYAGWTGE